MKIKQHGDHLFQLTRLGAFNCYFVRQEGGLTLIDTGLQGSASAILAAASQLGKSITTITLTHAHGDHAGSLDALANQLPDAEIALTARTAQFLQGKRTLEAGEPQAKLRGGFINCATRPTRLLQPGDKLGHLEVIAAPGHTPDHIAFLDSRDKSLIAGDALQTAGGIAVAGQLRLLFPFPAFATWHKPTALATAQQLAALAPSRLAVGHGAVLESPLPLMHIAIATAARKLGEPLNVNTATPH